MPVPLQIADGSALTTGLTSGPGATCDGFYRDMFGSARCSGAEIREKSTRQSDLIARAQPDDRDFSAR